MYIGNFVENWPKQDIILSDRSERQKFLLTSTICIGNPVENWQKLDLLDGKLIFSLDLGQYCVKISHPYL